MNIAKRINEAKMVALRLHANQTYDIFPYEKHLQDVVDILTEHGYADEKYEGKFICGGWLHDGMEDGKISYNDIKNFFGVEVAEIVFAVTDEMGRNRKERKAKTLPKTAANRDAVAIKLADRIANVEHSKRSGSSMFRRYQQEQPQFEAELYKVGEHEPLWHRLRIALQHSWT